MATIIKGNPDEELIQVKERLDAYERDHALLPDAAQLYRQNSASIRIRVINDQFAGMTRSRRHDQVWKYFAVLPEEVQEQITMLLLLPTSELKSSLVNFEFDDPLPSRL
jgi:stress-induced morphogen